MLSNHLTLDEEDAVQAELRELQAIIVSYLFVVQGTCTDVTTEGCTTVSKQTTHCPSHEASRGPSHRQAP